MDNMYDAGRGNRIITQSDTEIVTEAAAAPGTARGLHRSISVEYGESLQAALDESQTDTKCLGQRNCCLWFVNKIIDFFRRVFGSKEIIGPVMNESPKCSELVVKPLLADIGHGRRGEAAQSEAAQSEAAMNESPECSELVVAPLLADIGHGRRGEAVQSEAVQSEAVQSEAVQNEAAQEYTTAESPLRPISDPVRQCTDSDADSDSDSGSDSDVDSELDPDTSSDMEDYREILRSGFVQPPLSFDESGGWIWMWI